MSKAVEGASAKSPQPLGANQRDKNGDWIQKGPLAR